MVEEQDDLLDLPLPGENRPGENVAGDEPALPQTFQPPPGRRRRAGLLTVLLVIAAAAGGDFLPRPGPPVLASLQILLDFEQQRVGETTPERAIVLRNEGEKLLRVSEIRLEGTDAPTSPAPPLQRRSRSTRKSVRQPPAPDLPRPHDRLP